MPIFFCMPTKKLDAPFKSPTWIEQVFSDPNPVGFALQSIFCVFENYYQSQADRNTAHPATSCPKIVDQWLEQPNVRTLAPGDESLAVYFGR